MEKRATGLYSDVVIIGAGFSGVNMACQLQRKLGVTDYTIYDRGDGIGGAWSLNTYPGCGVDIPGVLYSLSWFPSPEFTRVLPPQQEILAYIRRIASAHGVARRTRPRTEWLGAAWDEGSATWRVSLRDLATGAEFAHEARVLVSAVGGFTNPKYPSIPGLGSLFRGDVVHTAEWGNRPLDGVRGRDVVVVGSGCSAAQVVPSIVEGVKSLTQFSRSPQHYLPSMNSEIHPFLRFVFSRVPFLLMLLRWLVFWYLESALFQFYDHAIGKRMRRGELERSRAYVKATAPKKYWDLLLPDYDMGCRRRILDNGYLRALHNPKMTLTKDAIASVGPRSVFTASGEEYPADTIILATGFQPTQWLGDTIVGRGGATMAQHWARLGGLEAYKSVAMHGFPNLFYLLGPNSGSGHTSVLYAIECETDLVVKMARPVLLGRQARRRRSRLVEVREEAEASWCRGVQETLRRTVLSRSCANQYCDPKTGWNYFSNPYSSLRFWLETRFPEPSHWRYD